MRDECGVFGVFDQNNNKDIAKLTYLGIFALQHRGQESAGIAVCDDKNILIYRDMGLVTEVFNEGILSTLQGKAAIGHVRYPTAGTNGWENSQPILFQYAGGTFALAHNGNLTNQDEIKDYLKSKSITFKEDVTDSYLICQLIAATKEKEMEEAIAKIVSQIKGAYCLVILTQDKLIGVRDGQGFHPLVLGKLDKEKGGYVIASEDCAFPLINAKYIREINPGEMIVVNKDYYSSKQIIKNSKKALCIFEHIYIARPDSKVFRENVAIIRERIGRKLAQEQPAEADMVIPVPDSGRFAALGYAMESGILYQEGLLKNTYVGRTFIQPNQMLREYSVRVKLSPIAEIVKNKKIVMVDDSIVRGTTSRKLVKLLKTAGAKEVHVRISSPPVNCPCHYGIDTPSKEELWATRFSVEEIRQWIEADSLGYISLNGLKGVFRKNKPEDFCAACFSGEYPI